MQRNGIGKGSFREFAQTTRNPNFFCVSYITHLKNPSRRLPSLYFLSFSLLRRKCRSEVCFLSYTFRLLCLNDQISRFPDNNVSHLFVCVVKIT